MKWFWMVFTSLGGDQFLNDLNLEKQILILIFYIQKQKIIPLSNKFLFM